MRQECVKMRQGPLTYLAFKGPILGKMRQSLDASFCDKFDANRMTRILGDDDFARLGKVVEALAQSSMERFSTSRQRCPLPNIQLKD